MACMSPCRKHITVKETHMHRPVPYVVRRGVWFGSQLRAENWFRVTRGCWNGTTCHCCSYSNFCPVDCIYQANIVFLCSYLKQKPHCAWTCSVSIWKPSLFTTKGGLQTRQDKKQLQCASPAAAAKPLIHSTRTGCMSTSTTMCPPITNFMALKQYSKNIFKKLSCSFQDLK